ncbi:MAG: cupin domain-containing protein [Planctomycetaceae bacterium]|nr:cupin domain-containing protein [Planctomycetaceae bacterium]
MNLERHQIAEDWNRRGFSCELWTDPPGQRWENFTHATDEVVVVLSGEMEFEIEGVVHHPVPGEELFIPARAVHSARNIGNETARWLFGYHQET